MNLELVRRDFTDKSTVGDLLVNHNFECYTLEDCVREGPKVPGQTAIPPGRYEVVITFSNRFQRPLPLLMAVPGFEGIRIHPGNTDQDTEGCILVGKVKSPNFVGQSRLAFAALFSKLKSAAKREKVFIAISEEHIDDFKEDPKDPFKKRFHNRIT